MFLVGVIMAVLSGLAIPGHLILFGQVINQFVFHIKASSSNFGNDSLTAIANEYASTMNTSCSVSLLIEGSLFSDVGETSNLLCDSQSGNVFSEVISFACDPNSQLESEIHIYSLIYVGLGVAVLVSTFFADIFFNISAYRQTRQIRLAYYRSVLHQEISWFDVNGVNQLSSRLTE